MPISLERKLSVRRLAERVFDLKTRNQREVPNRLLAWCEGDNDRALILVETARAIPSDCRIPITDLLAKAGNFATDIAKAEEAEAEQAKAKTPKAPKPSRPVAAKAEAPVAASQE